MQYASLKLASQVLGRDHPDVVRRASRAICKFMHNFSGMAYVFRRVIPDNYEVPVEGEPLLRTTWFWPRNFFFNYPDEFVHTWHMPSSDWKREIMSEYCTKDQMMRPLSRYELFCVQKKMREEDILNLGW